MAFRILILYASLVCLSGPYAFAAPNDDAVDAELEAEAASADSEAAIAEAQEARKRAKREGEEAKRAALEAEKAKKAALNTEATAKKTISENDKLEVAAKSKRNVLNKLRSEAEQRTAKAQNTIESSKAALLQANAERDKAQDQLREAERKERATREEMRDWERKLKLAKEEQARAEKKLADMQRLHLESLRQLSQVKNRAKVELPAAQKKLQVAESKTKAEQAAIDKQEQDMAHWKDLMKQAQADIKSAERGHLANTSKLKQVERSMTEVQAQVFEVLAQTDCNIRKTADATSPQLGKVMRGSKLSVSYFSEAWVRLHSGTRGYIARKCIE